MMNNRKTNIKNIFSTPIWTSILPNFEEINIKMYSYIENLRLNNPEGKIKSNLIGWFKTDEKWDEGQYHPIQPNTIPLIKTASDILGLELDHAQQNSISSRIK